MLEEFILIEKMNKFFDYVYESKKEGQVKIRKDISKFIPTNELNLSLSLEKYVDANSGDKMFSKLSNPTDELIKRMNISSYEEYGDVKKMEKGLRNYLKKIKFDSKWKHNKKEKVFIRI